MQKIVNIGFVLKKQLHDIGINTIDELKKIGSKNAWLKIKEIDSSACYNRLCALEGAIRNIKWHSLPIDIKEDLKEFYKKN